MRSLFKLLRFARSLRLNHNLRTPHTLIRCGAAKLPEVGVHALLTVLLFARGQWLLGLLQARPTGEGQGGEGDP